MRERFMVIKMMEMTGYIYDENDDMAPVMDAILQRIGMGVSYGKDDDDEWITRVHHRDMEDAIRDMAPKEEAIICKFFFDKKNILDIQRETGLPLDLIGGFIKTMKASILIWL